MFWYKIAMTDPYGCQSPELDPSSPDFNEKFDNAYLCEFQRAHDRKHKLQRLLEHAAGKGSRYNGRVLVNVKECPSAKGKFVKKKKYRRISDMPDILRAAVLIPKAGPHSSLEACAEDICRKLPSCQSEPKDDPKTGYQAYHIDAEIDGMRLEVQVNYKGAWTAKEIAHLSYKDEDSEIPCGTISSEKPKFPLVEIEGNQYPRAIGPKNDLEMQGVLGSPAKAPQAVNKRERKHKELKNKGPSSFNRWDMVSVEAFNLRRIKTAEAAKGLTCPGPGVEAFNLRRIKTAEAATSPDEFNFVVLQKPLAIGKEQQIEDFILSSGAKIVKKKTVMVDSRHISQHYRQFLEKPYFMPIVRYYTGKQLHVWLCRANIEVLNKMRSTIGRARVDEGSFRHSLVGEEHSRVKQEHGVMDNGVHVSDSPGEGDREAQVWFGVPPVKPIYDDPQFNQYVIKVHNTIWQALNSLPVVSVQYSNTNNETAVKSKPVDLDYRVLVNEGEIDKFVDAIIQALPGAVYDKDGVDERTGAKYKKLEYPFTNGKADIAVVPVGAYKGRIGTGHMVDVLPEEVKMEIGRRKEEAWQKGKEEYKRVKEQIQHEIKQRFGF